MLILWSVLLTTAVAHKVVDSNEDIGPEAFGNITTLYPVTANTTTSTNTENDNIDHHGTGERAKIPSNHKEEKLEISEEANTLEIQDDKIDTEAKDDTTKSKSDATIWKIEAHFGETGSEKEDLSNVTKEFRPSQHLGNIIEVYPTTPTSYDYYTPVVKKPASGFVSPTKDYRTQYNIPKYNHNIYETHKQYPYKFDGGTYPKTTTSWNLQKPIYWGPTGLKSPSGPDSLETRPTAEVPVRVPAGGLYQYQDPFRDKPVPELTAFEGFGLGLNEEHKENAVGKRESPWQDLLRLLTAFIPVGIIISALTPSIITIENTGGDSGYPLNEFRRSDPGGGGGPALSTLPAISERCRRRLLCELHSDNNYVPYGSPAGRNRKHCYKIRCENPEALATTLRWLIHFKQKQK